MAGDDDPSLRLRQAIIDDDLPLVQRLLRHNLTLLQNPDFRDKSNTSLHLAALHGQLEIAVGVSASWMCETTANSKRNI